MNDRDKLLSIAIPTYNRSRYLDLCLSQICKQLTGKNQHIEVIVSDNASTDDTEGIVQKYVSSGNCIRYVKNNTNIGPDGNIAQAFTLATSKYVLVLSDDDVLVDGAVERIVNILRTGEYGIIHLNSYPYRTDFISELPKRQYSQVFIYDDVKRYMKKVNYFFTFISGNIVNKTLVDDDMEIKQFDNTNMVQLSWIFSALFNAKKNVFVEPWTIAAKSDNTGGYRICKVFGVNLNQVFQYFIDRGVTKSYFKIINRRLLFSFFPNYIRGLRRIKGGYHQENYFETLYPVFGRYLNFWFFTVPSIVLPLPAVRFVMSFIREFSKLFKRIGRYRDMLLLRALRFR